eukprot:354234-Chlamydomonas_euryale.AAC.2
MGVGRLASWHEAARVLGILLESGRAHAPHLACAHAPHLACARPRTSACTPAHSPSCACASPA